MLWEQLLDYLGNGDMEMLRNIFDYVMECPHAKRRMKRYCNCMGFTLNHHPHRYMTPGLVSSYIPILLEAFHQIVPTNTPGEFHTGISSSLTMWSRIMRGRSSS